jgi:hypothetical protein
MTSKYLEPSAKGMRNPLDNRQDNGPVVNPPRLNQFGGLDKIKEPYGAFKNKMSIVKPGKGR